MNIGIVIGRIGGVDGVALETEKWISVLERMGHNCYVLSGELEADIRNVELLPELSFFHENCLMEQDMAFFKQDVEETVVSSFIERNSEVIKEGIINWIQRKNIKLLIAENSSTIPCHLSMGVGLEKVYRVTGINSLIHNHDFYWERGTRYKTKYLSVNSMMEKCFPPVLDNVKHAVINSYGKFTLKTKLGVDSTIIPNVMDFLSLFAIKDDYNADLLVELGLNKDDIPLFQITRIVRRKGIETAIELIQKLNDIRYKLIITGSAKDDERLEYFNELQEIIRKYHLEKQIIFAEDRFDNVRRVNSKGQKVYSLEDAYAYARAMTYFSTYEGFGNAFVEAVLAKVPVFVNNYKPVYWPDIGSKGFKTVQLEENLLTDEAISEIKEILHNPDLSKKTVSNNFNLGKEHFSYEVLETLLTDLI